MREGRILFIDAYDSFSNSIVALLRKEVPAAVASIKIDDARFVLNDEAFYDFLDDFDAVVAGPGPGHPAVDKDVGLIGKLWHLPDKHVLPVLGICLGFQSLCLAFGARIERLREPRHGVVARVEHVGKDIFSCTDQIVATQYHSLHARLERTCPMSDERSDIWLPSANGLLAPLAYSLNDPSNGDVLMAVRHSSKPFWGLQYHPESICTDGQGQRSISRWWQLVHDWQAEQTKRDSGLSLRASGSPQVGKKQASSPARSDKNGPNARKVLWRSKRLLQPVNVASVVSMLRSETSNSEPILLESGVRNGKPINPKTGRYSIIGLTDSDSVQIQYIANERRLTLFECHEPKIIKNATIRDAFHHIEAVMQLNRASGGVEDLPFWGGFVGFVSYEAGLQSIGVVPPKASLGASNRPDIWFTFVERSIVLDHRDCKVYVQSLRRDDESWMQYMHQKLHAISQLSSDSVHCERGRHGTPSQICRSPQKVEYCRKVHQCQSKLRAGESYELCLTDQTCISNLEAPWTLYERLRKQNPAPFGCYMRLKGQASVSIVGSSPERFLSWSRSGKCQFRPIKGTVKKESGVSREKAEKILGTAKERAENLMIVDLIRHDLNGVNGVHNVQVTELMEVEEYETVFQLVSVIEGDLDKGVTGSTVLSASLPPGSMTGAPKMRSCDILCDLEDCMPRGIYSGVLGYFDVGGGGDFSVVIRTAFKWDDAEVWHIGAGGAITAMSKPEDEWDEMNAKLDSLLPSFL